MSETNDILKVNKSDSSFKEPEDRIISASKGRPTIVIPFLAQSFTDYCLSDDQFYKYNGKHYELVEDKIIGKAIHDWYVKKGIFPCWNLSKERELMVLLRYNDIIKSVEMDSDDNLLNMNNGTLNIETGDFYKHSPKNYFSYCLSVNYDGSKTIDDCPNFVKFLSGCFAKSGNWEKGYITDEIMFQNMIRLCGYLMYPKITITGMFIFLGEGSNGKGILTEIISSFFPSRFVSHMSLSALSNEQSKGRTELLTSKLNISTEEKGEKIPTEEIKKITDGECISLARMYKDNISIRPHCKLLLSNNQMPYFNDSSFGIMRRVKMFNFLNQFLEEREYEKVSKAEQRRIFKGQPKQELLDMIELEKPAILNLFIKGLKEMKADKWRFLESENMIKIKEEYKEVNDPLGQWLVDNYELSEGTDFIGIIYIFNEFNDFYMANNTKKSPYSTNFISRKIKDKFRIESIRYKEKDSLNVWKTVSGFCLKKRKSNEEELMAELKF